MSKDISLKFYSDQGHGWICVKVSLLFKLGIQYSFDEYSYIRGKSIYIEEDSLRILINALKENGYNYNYIEKHTDKSSPIRSYERATIDNIMKAKNY